MASAPERRTLRFESIDDVLAEAEQLAAGEVRTTGNYSCGQIFEHLARTLDVVTGHMPGGRVPLPMRIMARMIRPFVLTRPMNPGFKLPANVQSVFWPEEDVETAASLDHLRESVERYKRTDPLPKHPVFGKMTKTQSDQLQCRHSELHLSFIHPRS